MTITNKNNNNDNNNKNNDDDDNDDDDNNNIFLGYCGFYLNDSVIMKDTNRRVEFNLILRIDVTLL